MCEKCAEAVEKYIGQYSPEEQENILWNLTAFPFAGPEQLEEQLRHIAEVGLEQAWKEAD